MAESSPTSPQPKRAKRECRDEPSALSSSNVCLTEELQCSVCLDVFNDPVSTPCGHNFCKSCLKPYWDNSHIYSCPMCKETFSKRPDLKINTTLRQVALLFIETFNQRRSEVLCDICDERKLKALKSCLVCQASYCETHLELHQKLHSKKHKLMDPVENIKDYICQKHERPLELFCRDDQTCVCVFCTEGDHKTHNTVPLEEESKDKKTQLKKTQTNVQQMILERIKKIQDIRHSAELRKRNTDEEKAASVEVFSALIRSIERCQTELLEMMDEQQKAAEKQDEDLMKDLEQEITELKCRDSELEQLSHTENHLHLIQIDPSLYSPPHTKNWSEISMKTDVSVETLRRALTQLQETLDDKLTQTVLRRMQQYAVDVTLDPVTAHPKLILSEDGKQLKLGARKLKLPDNPERFNRSVNVLGKEGFSSGRFYFEVQVKGKTYWTLGVARESINRKGKITFSPQNGFWTVALKDEHNYLACVNADIPLSLRVSPQMVGVFVDHEEGLVCFYDVENRSHIYSFTGQTFAEKLFPYFSPCRNHEGKNSAPLIISPVHYNK
ncbi:E3 ubiquitin-protein ligase TRIM39-like [Triplophysa dalaica]|uniref:E3 ubiquitin-protein ligase TRIM39-like n=1 Tax=Triplophysa dalaica TaxID=1582913 RepID=UPI0024DF5728|nr:E3 ubiquitin-protein ligase TRIM39-like [Triplophysa dalaica]XP_056603180.1 E3 ubiquitin-protein ligase TRIM39-like [Triplophysa dalaica]